MLIGLTASQTVYRHRDPCRNELIKSMLRQSTKVLIAFTLTPIFPNNTFSTFTQKRVFTSKLLSSKVQWFIGVIALRIGKQNISFFLLSVFFVCQREIICRKSLCCFNKNAKESHGFYYIKQPYLMRIIISGSVEEGQCLIVLKSDTVQNIADSC